MKITVDVNVNAPELSAAIVNLTTVLTSQGKQTVEQPGCDQSVTKPELQIRTSTEPNPVPTYTLEQVRAKLAALSQAGKQAQVKKIITDYDVKKLTDIPAEKYAEIMKTAETI